MVLRVLSPFFPGILLSGKPPETRGKRLVIGKNNGESAYRMVHGARNGCSFLSPVEALGKHRQLAARQPWLARSTGDAGAGAATLRQLADLRAGGAMWSYSPGCQGQIGPPAWCRFFYRFFLGQGRASPY